MRILQLQFSLHFVCQQPQHYIRVLGCLVSLFSIPLFALLQNVIASVWVRRGVCVCVCMYKWCSIMKTSICKENQMNWLRDRQREREQTNRNDLPLHTRIWTLPMKYYELIKNHKHTWKHALITLLNLPLKMYFIQLKSSAPQIWERKKKCIFIGCSPYKNARGKKLDTTQKY